MRVAIAPASTRTGAAVIRSLLATSSTSLTDIDAYYRKLASVPVDFSSHKDFHAKQGDVTEASTLDFANVDAVLVITPPAFDGREIIAHAETIARNVRQAAERSGSVRNVVLLSSIGAQFSHGVGEIKTNNAAERILADTKVAKVTFVRCAYFMENWAMMGLATLKEEEPFLHSTITPLDWKVPMVAVQDIGATLAAELLDPSEKSPKPHIYELHGPRQCSPEDVRRAFSRALGKEIALKPVERSELAGFYSRFFPPQIVGEWVEMATSFLPGGVIAPDVLAGEKAEVVHGSTELDEAIAEVVRNFQK